MERLLTTLGVIAVALILAMTDACAANVKILSHAITSIEDDTPTCNVRLSGPIIAGDVNQIGAAFKELGNSYGGCHQPPGSLVAVLHVA